jgi:hypothetical protein
VKGGAGKRSSLDEWHKWITIQEHLRKSRTLPDNVRKTPEKHKRSRKGCQAYGSLLEHSMVQEHIWEESPTHSSASAAEPGFFSGGLRQPPIKKLRVRYCH